MIYYITTYGNIIDENHQHIPQEENNLLYQNFLIYLRSGGIVESTDFKLVFERDEIPETPLWRIRVILKIMGQEENILSAINNLPEPIKTAAEYVWHYGTVIERNSSTVLFIQQLLGLTNIEVDEIFNQANSIMI